MASNSLSPERRAKLLDAIQKMEAAGESQEYIQGVVDHYKAKYAGAAPSPPKVAGGYMEGPSKYQENFGGDPLNYVNAIPGVPYSLPLGKALDAFPNMGGAVGGVVGGVPGAGVGGGSMDMLRRSLRGMPLDPRASALEGGRQALLQGKGAVLGGAATLAAKGAAPVARMAESAMANPMLRRLGSLSRYGLPALGGVRGGIPGALAGMALPAAGRAALEVAKSPKTEAFLGSMAFRTFARHFPQAANQIVKQLTAPQE